jgi:O-acetyl-ADP-ribose deacetylase
MSDSLTINKTRIELEQGDITQQNVDAIVNAANSALAGGGGVDGAIHRAAGGAQLQASLRQYNGCRTGSAVITPGFNLAAKYIIHAVGPIYQAGSAESPRLLAGAYRRSFELAAENGAKTVACPAISTGIFGYPMGAAAEVALKTAITFAQENDSLELIRFVLFGNDALQVFQAAMESLDAKP